MFTSEPSLAQRIERMIADTPIVDGYSQIRPDRPGAPDLATLMGESGVGTELISVGMPPGDLDPALPPVERVRRSIPYLKRTRNTATAWCLFRVFRDLYDFGDPHLTEANYRDLFDKVARSAADPAWADSVLRERCKIRAVVTGLGREGADESKNPESFYYYRLDARTLVSPGRLTPGDYLDALAETLGERPETSGRLERLVDDWLDRTVTGRVRCTRIVLPIGRGFRPPEAGTVDALLGRGVGGKTIADDPIDAVVDRVAWSILKWHHENRKTVQIAVDAESSDGDGPTLLPRPQGWASELARTFRQFADARFALISASDLLAKDVAMLAGRLPNVYASGDWSRSLLPMAIERAVRLRLQAAPMTKAGGFLSDAGSAEWGYGKLQVVRKATAVALAGMVEARFFEEDEIPPLLRQTLHDTPRDLFELGER